MDYAREHNKGEDEPIFTLTRQQVYNIIIGMVGRSVRKFIPIRYAIVLLSTGYGRIRISGDCSYYKSTAA